MELYLLHNDSAIVLAKPGLFELQAGATAGATPTEASPPVVTPTTDGATGATGSNIGNASPGEQLTIPRPGNQEWGTGQHTFTFTPNTGATRTPVTVTATRDASNADNMVVTLPSGLTPGGYTYSVTEAGNTTPVHSGNATIVPVRTADGANPRGGANGPQPTPGEMPPPGQTFRSGAYPTTEEARTYATGFNATGGPNQRTITSMFQIAAIGTEGQPGYVAGFSYPDGRGYTANDVETTRGELDARVSTMDTSLTQARDRRALLRRHQDAGTIPSGDDAIEGVTDAASLRAELSRVDTQIGNLETQIGIFRDRSTRSTHYETVLNDFGHAETQMQSGNYEPMQRFQYFYQRQGVLSVFADQNPPTTQRQPSRATASIAQHVSDASEIIRNGPPEENTRRGGGGQMGTQSTAQALNGVANGIHAFGNVVDATSRVGYGVANLGNSASAIDRAFGGQGFSNPGIFAGGGFGGLGGFGGFGGLGMYGVGGAYGFDEEGAFESQRLRALLVRLLHAIRSGDTDAIGQALTIVGLMSRKTLQRTAMLAIRSMSQLQQKMEDNNSQIAGLSSNGNPQYASQLQFLSNRMQGYNMDRQAIVSLLRQVKAADDEIWNTDKAWKDVHLRQLRQWSTWNA